MSAFWGTSYYTVIASDLRNCFVGQVNHYPSFEDENVYEPVLQEGVAELGTVTLYKTELEAVANLRAHIIESTHSDLLAYNYNLVDSEKVIALSKPQLALLRLQPCSSESDLKFRDESISRIKQKVIFERAFIKETKQKIADLNKLRKAKINIVYDAGDFTKTA